jgi:hypothetical protein
VLDFQKIGAAKLLPNLNFLRRPSSLRGLQLGPDV